MDCDPVARSHLILSTVCEVTKNAPEEARTSYRVLEAYVHAHQPVPGLYTRDEIYEAIKKNTAQVKKAWNGTERFRLRWNDADTHVQLNELLELYNSWDAAVEPASEKIINSKFEASISKEETTVTNSKKESEGLNSKKKKKTKKPAAPSVPNSYGEANFYHVSPPARPPPQTSHQSWQGPPLVQYVFYPTVMMAPHPADAVPRAAAEPLEIPVPAHPDVAEANGWRYTEADPWSDSDWEEAPQRPAQARVEVSAPVVNDCDERTSPEATPVSSARREKEVVFWQDTGAREAGLVVKNTFWHPKAEEPAGLLARVKTR